MIHKSIAVVALAIVATTIVPPVARAATATGRSMRHERAKVSPASARRIALRTVRGTIRTSELERESGGSGLRYTFDIATARGVREVGIDAADGRVLENSSDTPAPTTH